MAVKKEVIRPGTYSYVNQRTGNLEKLVVTPETIKHYHDNGNAMRKAGINIPLPLEHQPDAVPLSDADLAAKQLLNNAGFINGYEIGEVREKDGTITKDVLFGSCDIRDPDVAKKAQQGTIPFVSPWISSFTDGNGRKWDGVIGHVALTTKPRITSQSGFQFDGMAASLSLLGYLSEPKFAADKLPNEGVYLSKAGRVAKVDGKMKPECPVAFSMMVGAKLSDDEIKKIKDVQEVDDDDEEDLDDDIFGEESEDIDIEPESTSPLDKNKDGTVDLHEIIRHMLEAHGFMPSPAMSAETAMRDIYEALMAKTQEVMAASKAEKTEPTTPDPANKTVNTGTNPVVQESPSMYASLAEINKIADPEKRAMAGMIFSLQQQDAANKALVESVRKKVLDDEQAKRQARVNKLAAKYAVPRERDAFLSMMAAPSAKLSLSGDGKVIDPMATTLDALDAAFASVPKMPDLLRMQASGVQPTEQEQPNGGVMTAARRNEILAGMNIPAA